MEFPTLYGKPSTSNKIKVWKIHVSENDENGASIIREHGYVDHKQTKSIKLVEKGKNIGKKNETTPTQQALNEATHIWKKQIESGYVENINTLYEENILKVLPMLAHDFRKRNKDISSNFFIQPKIDGVRMIATFKNGCIEFYSRTGKIINGLDHIRKELFDKNILTEEGFYLDGEIFTFDLTFEQISGLFRTIKLNDKQKAKMQLLKFHIFDCFYTNEKSNYMFSDRLQILKSIPILKFSIVVKTEHFNKHKLPMKNIISSTHDKYVQSGYEGIMVRNSESLYKMNYRSKDLQKFKEFLDEEFEIISGKEATGEDAGTIIFLCKTNKNHEFYVRPRGSRELRKYMFENLERYIGKQLTVRYQNLSEDKQIPRFPVGITVRDYE
jgi:DNA ligase-1